MADLVPADLIVSIANMILFLKAIGVLFIIYLTWMIVRGVLTLKINKQISTMYKDIKSIKRQLKVKN